MRGRVPLPLGEGVEARRRAVEEIRRRIQEGTYRVDSAEVAAAVLEALRESRHR